MLCFIFGHKKSEALYKLSGESATLEHRFCDRCNSSYDVVGKKDKPKVTRPTPENPEDTKRREYLM